jgi:hypothetical protein
LEPSLEPISSTVLQALRGAHERTTHGVHAAAEAVRSLLYPAALQHFAACRRSAQRYLAAEHTILFPLLDEHGADTARLRSDHAMISDAFDRSQAQLDRGAIEEFCDTAQEVMVAITAHRIREERLFRSYAGAIVGASAPLLAHLVSLLGE